MLPNRSWKFMRKPVANKKQKLIIWCGLILLVLATRIGYRYHCPIVTRDAVEFIQWAQTSRTDINQLLTSNVQEPLYPLLLSLSATVPQIMGIDPIRCWEYAGVTLGIIGTLVILAAVYLIGKHLFNEKVGLLAAFFAALIPKLIAISASGMSEPVFLAFLSISTASMLVACRGSKLARVLMPLAAGMLAVASFLTRKEGLILLPLYVIFLMLPVLKMAWRKRLLVGALLLVGVAVSLWGYAGTGGKVHWLKGYQRFWKIRTFAAIAPDAPFQKIPEADKPLAIAKTFHTRSDFLWEPIHRWFKLCPRPIAFVCPQEISHRWNNIPTDRHHACVLSNNLCPQLGAGILCGEIPAAGGGIDHAHRSSGNRNPGPGHLSLFV